MKIEVELTKDEAEALDNYAFRKMCRLEDSDLTDAVCYGMFSKLHREIARKLSKNTFTKDNQCDII